MQIPYYNSNINIWVNFHNSYAHQLIRNYDENLAGKVLCSAFDKLHKRLGT